MFWSILKNGDDLWKARFTSRRDGNHISLSQISEKGLEVRISFVDRSTNTAYNDNLVHYALMYEAV